MPTGPILPDHDEPERTPTVVPIWHFANYTSFTRFNRSLSPAYLVVVPFPFAPVIDPERGIVLRGLWADGPSYGPADVIAAAQRNENGFRLLGQKDKTDVHA